MLGVAAREKREPRRNARLNTPRREKLEQLREVLLEGTFVLSVEGGDAVEGTATAGEPRDEEQCSESSRGADRAVGGHESIADDEPASSRCADALTSARATEAVEGDVDPSWPDLMDRDSIGSPPRLLIRSKCFLDVKPIARTPCVRKSSKSAVPTPPFDPVTSAAWPGCIAAVR